MHEINSSVYFLHHKLSQNDSQHILFNRMGIRSKDKRDIYYRLAKEQGWRNGFLICTKSNLTIKFLKKPQQSSVSVQAVTDRRAI